MPPQPSLGNRDAGAVFGRGAARSGVVKEGPKRLHLDVHMPWSLQIIYSKATPIRKSLRRMTRHVSLNPSSGTTNVNFAGITVGSDTSNAAPVIDRSRIVQVILSPPYSIFAGFMTR